MIPKPAVLPFVLTLLFLVEAPCAHALATGSTVFDPMNFMRNTTTALNSIQQVEAEAETVLTLEEEFRAQLAEWRSYPGRTLVDLAGGRALDDQIRSYQHFLAALRRTRGSVDAAYHRLLAVNRRLASARISWSGYEKNLNRGLRKREHAAEHSVLLDRRLLASVASDYRRLRLLEARLDAPGSLKQELELLNDHMGTLTASDAAELALLAHHAERRARGRSHRAALDRAILSRYRRLKRRDRALLSRLLATTANSPLAQRLRFSATPSDTHR